MSSHPTLFYNHTNSNPKMDNGNPDNNHQKPNTDQVVVFMDQLSNPKPTPQQTDQPQDPTQQQPSTRTKTFGAISFSKPKARFAEPNYPYLLKTTREDQFYSFTSHDDHNTSPSTSSDDEDWFDSFELDDEDDDNDAPNSRKKYKEKRINKRALIEWTLFLTIMTCLICSLTLKSLQHEVKWGLEIWKWCLMVMVFFCGRLVSGWLVAFLVFLIERNFMLREKVLYFVYGLRKSFQNCAWLALALLSWTIMFPNVHKHHPVLKKLFRALIAVLIDATIWLLKIVLVKVLASSFHVTTFFDRMKESVFHHYILESLSGPPLDEAEIEPLKGLQASKSLPARLANGGGGAMRAVSRKFGSRRIDMERLKRLSLHRRATAWSVRRLVKYVRSSGLSTISKTVDDFEAAGSELQSDWEARTNAQRIFKHVAKPGAK